MLDRHRAAGRPRAARAWLAALIAADLGLLAYFKYLGFAIEQIGWLTGTRLNVAAVVLPVGISFYTFTQIAYLVDVFRGKARERSFVGYVLFVTYFPHLVAGPVLHHAEMMPQFNDARNLRFDAENFCRGLTFFAFGLFKKIVLADGCAPIADAVFGADAPAPSAAQAWIGAVAYTLQIYYDFSGYSDMAVGLSLMFNVRLPINFESPYQARSIIDFWRRWHITLSRFLRDYLYIALGGNRRGPARRHANLLLTMLLGGLWHGANWTFVIWGALHGVYLVVNHAWRHLWARRPQHGAAPAGSALAAAGGWLLTMVAVVVAWVFFRADTVGDALVVLAAMFGLGSAAGAQASLLDPSNVAFLGALGAWAALAPNTNRIMDYGHGLQFPAEPVGERLRWRPRLSYAVLAGTLLFASAFVGLTGRKSLAFLYFQF